MMNFVAVSGGISQVECEERFSIQYGGPSSAQLGGAVRLPLDGTEQ